MWTSSAQNVSAPAPSPGTSATTTASPNAKPDIDQPISYDKQTNWIRRGDQPCGNIDLMRKYKLGRIGVRYTEVKGTPWAKAFEQAFAFWGTVLDATFYKENDIRACAVSIVTAPPAIFKADKNKKPCLAVAQVPGYDYYTGEIAANPDAERIRPGFTDYERFLTAVHEVGHMLGLFHNRDVTSVMYANGFDGNRLNAVDLFVLRKNDKVREFVIQLMRDEKAALEIPVPPGVAPTHAKPVAIAHPR